METDTPPERSRLSRLAVLALVVPVLAIVFLMRSGGDAAVDLYTEDDLALAGVEFTDETSSQAQTNSSASDTHVAVPNEATTTPDAAPEAIAQTADGEVEQTTKDPAIQEDSLDIEQAGTLTGTSDLNANAPNTNVTSTTIADTTQPIPIGQPAEDRTVDVAEATETTSALWCEIEVRAVDGILRWSDDDRTAVFRKNDAWFHTPEEEALAILIPEAVDTDDEYVLRVWGGGTQDVVCTFVAGATQTASPVDTTTTSTTTTTTTTVPEAVAFTQLPNPISVPGGPVQMGFNVDLWGSDRTSYWNDLEAVPGNGRLIAHEFKSFTKPINTSLYQWHMDQGRDLLLTWNGTTASSILDGTHDDWIRQHAQELDSLSGTVKLRFWHEPDVSYKASWIEGDPQNYIDAWMHVRRLFVDEGAIDNIEWVWCPTAWNWNEQGARFYPGDANVDWICADGYSGMNLDKPLSPISAEFTAFQAWANQHPSKPILIAEFGATERDAGDRAQWVQGIPGWVNASPNIRAVVYFDYDKRSEQPWDWRLRTEADAWQAMMDVLSTAPFGT